MAGFFIPDPRFEMPSLLEPGRKPVGPVEIHWQDGLTRGLKSFVISRPELIEIAKNTPLIAATGSSTIDSSFGHGPTYTTDDSTSTTYTTNFGSIGSNSGFTVLARFYLTAIDSFGAPIFYSLNGSGSNRRIEIGQNGSGKIYVSFNTTWQKTWTKSFPLNEWVTAVGVMRPDLTCTIYVKDSSGIFSETVTDIADNGDFSINEMGFGASQESPGTRNCTGSIELSGLWNRPASEGEARLIVNNPYQFLIPK
tara:strand:+ start:24 stop:779 length:756 start_codon:yes stop_codon:yes gene_type:complete